jgi:hypothetical protein
VEKTHGALKAEFYPQAVHNKDSFEASGEVHDSESFFSVVPAPICRMAKIFPGFYETARDVEKSRTGFNP